MTATKKEAVQIVMPEGRLINASLFEKDVYTGPDGKDGVPSYKIEMAYDPKLVTGEGTGEDEVLNAICDAYGDVWQDDFLAGKLATPYLNGDKLAAAREQKGKNGDAYKGKIVCRANTNFNHLGQDAPGGIYVAGPDAKQIIAAQANLIYPGCWGIMIVTVGTYMDNRSNAAAKFYLSAFQKTRDDDPLISPRDYSSVFKPQGGAAGVTAGAGARRSRRG